LTSKINHVIINLNNKLIEGVVNIMKIHNYGILNTIENGYINEDQIQVGMSLRIEGRISEVEDMLESINYEVITEGHEIKNNKRVYIKVLATEIEIKEKITCREFKEKVQRAERYGTIYNDSEETLDFDEVELKTIVWHTCDGLYVDIYLENGNRDTLLDIAFITGKDLYKMADTEENTKKLLKATKKALIKYTKWCENFDIKINEIKEENC